MTITEERLRELELFHSPRLEEMKELVRGYRVLAWLRQHGRRASKSLRFAATLHRDADWDEMLRYNEANNWLGSILDHLAADETPPTLAVSQETDVSQQDYPEGTPFEVTAYLESTKERAPIAWAATAAKAAAAATHLENAGLQFVQVRDCRVKQAPPVATKVCPECGGDGECRAPDCPLVPCDRKCATCGGSGEVEGERT